jgi:tetratricopeptide (TPR) repeat protein
VALAHTALGIAYENLDADLSLRHFTDCLEVSRRHKLRGGEALALLNIGNISGITGRLDQALVATARALALRKALNDPQGVGAAMCHLAMIHAVRGDLDEAVACADAALIAARQVGDQYQEKATLLTRSEAQLRKGWLGAARRDAEAAELLAADRGHRYMAALSSMQKSKVLATEGEAPLPSKTEMMPIIVRTAAGIRRDLLLERVLLSR